MAKGGLTSWIWWGGRLKVNRPSGETQPWFGKVLMILHCPFTGWMGAGGEGLMTTQHTTVPVQRPPPPVPLIVQSLSTLVGSFGSTTL